MWAYPKQEKQNVNYYLYLYFLAPLNIFTASITTAQYLGIYLSRAGLKLKTKVIKEYSW